MSEGKFVSPNEMMGAAKDLMLGGKEPTSTEDWAKIVNFLAANIARGLEESAMKLLKMIYEIPLPDDYIEEICKFQYQRKNVEQC